MCRQIMRIYTCFDYDIAFSRLKANICPDITKEYYPKEKDIVRTFSSAGIEMAPTATESCFGNKIIIVPQVFFVYKLKQYIIPRQIINKLKEFLARNGVQSNQLIGETILYFGYTGRMWDRETNSKYVTDGLQRNSTNDIIIDFALYEVAPYDTYLYRLIHELLHTLGIEEEQMNSLISAACIYMTATVKEFIIQLQKDCPLVFNNFKSTLSNIQSDNNQMVEFLRNLGTKLYTQNGYYQSPYSIDECKVFYPTSFSPLKIGDFSILFM